MFSRGFVPGSHASLFPRHQFQVCEVGVVSSFSAWMSVVAAPVCPWRVVSAPSWRAVGHARGFLAGRAPCHWLAWLSPPAPRGPHSRELRSRGVCPSLSSVSAVLHGFCRVLGSTCQFLQKSHLGFQSDGTEPSGQRGDCAPDGLSAGPGLHALLCSLSWCWSHGSFLGCRR